MEEAFTRSVKAIYTDLDSIFDTRAVLLAALSDMGRYDLRIFGKSDITNYFNRYRDNFGTVSAWIFHYYYKNRASSLLTHADLTNVPEFINNYILDSVRIATKDTDATIYVNTWPYTLGHEETMTMLDVLDKVFPNTNIIFINIPSREIEPSWIAEKDIGLIISYSVMEWLNYQVEKNNGLIPEIINVKVIAPFILEGTITEKELSPDLVDDLTAFFRVMCDFAFVPAKEFCLTQREE